MACLCFTSCLYSSITYQDCESVVDVISKETKAITAINPADHDELAKMHVSRGESYMLSEQSEKAIEDFEKALFHAEYSSDVEFKMGDCF